MIQDLTPAVHLRGPGMEPARDRYRTFLSLSGEGIARFELDRPLRAEAPEDEQVEHLLRHGRVAACNELFARFYGREAAQTQGLAMGELFPSEEPGRQQGIREFIRSGYRLVYAEEEHVQADGSSRWISGSALGALEDGCLHAFWLCLRDITDRKQGEADRERRGRILEAVAYSAARLLQPGSWRAHADLVLERLGLAAGVARVWLAELEEGPDGVRFLFRLAWGAPGVETRLDDPRILGDPATCVAPGMPQSAIRWRSVEEVVPLSGLAARILCRAV